MPPEVTTGSGAAVVETPAGGAGAALAAPPAPSATDAAIEAAKARLATTGTILPEGAAEPEKIVAGAEAAPAETDEQRAAREAAEAAAPPAPEAGAEDLTITLVEGEGEAAKQFTFTAPNKEAFDALTARLADVEHPELEFTFDGLPERGEQDVKVELPDAVSLERVRRMANDAKIGRQVKAERRAIERQAEEIDGLRDQVTGNPVGFIFNELAPEVRLDVGKQFLFEPGALEAIQSWITTMGYEGGIAAVLDDPQALQTIRAQLGESRAKMELALHKQVETRRTMRQSALRTISQIEQLIPAHIEGEDREKAFQMVRGEVAEATRRMFGDRWQEIEPEDIAMFTERALRKLNISTQPPTPAGNGQDGGKQTVMAGGAKPPAQAGSKTAAQLKQESAARAAAAAAAPGGAGAPPVKPRPTLPSDTQGVIDKIRSFGPGGLRKALGKT